MTGCRRGEAIGVQWGDLDLAQKTVIIRRTVASDGSLRSIHDHPKTRDSGRIVALTPYLVNVLQEHRAAQELERQRHPDWPGSPWVFLNSRGHLLWPNDVWKAFKRLVERAVLPSTIRPHDLRPAMATFWLTQGVPIKVVSERLGHANITVTLEIYGHLVPHMQSVAATEMERRFLESGPETPSTYHPHERKNPPEYPHVS